LRVREAPQRCQHSSEVIVEVRGRRVDGGTFD